MKPPYFKGSYEDAIAHLLHGGHAVVVLNKEELSGVDPFTLMKLLFAGAHEILNEVKGGVRCPECLCLIEEHDKVH